MGRVLRTYNSLEIMNIFTAAIQSNLDRPKEGSDISSFGRDCNSGLKLNSKSWVNEEFKLIPK